MISNDELWQKINSETARIDWPSLAPQFAAGQLIFVAPELDLIETAVQFSTDNTQQVTQWLNTEKVMRVNDAQAIAWQDKPPMFWAVVVKPWVLIQYCDTVE